MGESATLARNANAGNGIANQLDYANQYVSFWVDNQLLAVPVNAVQDVLNPQTIARTPKVSPGIGGLLNLRGQIVTAVNLESSWGCGISTETARI